MTSRAAVLVRTVFVIAAVAALSLGYVGLDLFLVNRPQFGHRVIDLVYYDLQLFVIDSEPVGEGGPYPWPLEIARFLAPAVTGYALTEAARLLFATEIARLRARTRSGHIVVCGDSLAARALATHLAKVGQRVVLVRGDHVDHVDVPGLLEAVGGTRLAAVLEAAGLARAARLYACEDKTAANIATVLAAGQVKRRVATTLEVYAHVGDPELGDALRAGEFNKPQRQDMQVDFFSLDGIAARAVVAAEAEETDRLVVIGLSAFGRALLLELARRAERSDGHPIEVVVVDPNGRAIVEELRARNPDFDESCAITVKAFYQPEPGAHRVFVCHDDEERALRDGLKASATVDETSGTVIVRMRQLAGVGEMIVQHGHDDRLRFVGVLDMASVYLSERIADSLARAVHRRYVQRQSALGHTSRDNPALTGWDDLSETLRNANRAQAVDIESKLEVIGCRAVPRLEQTSFTFEPHEIEQLAIAEHNRWMAERRADGWRYGPVRNNKAKIHPDLRPWSELGEEERQKDRDAVLAMPAILADAGYQVIREQP